MYEAGTLALVRPKTTARRGYSSHLFSQAVLFLIGHEIAHITLGHVDYLNSKTSIPVLPEIGWNLASPVGRIERQTLEVEADSRSIISRLESVRLTLHTLGRQVPSWSSEPAGFKSLLFDCAFSINALFRNFGDVRFTGSDLSSASYPPLPLRRAALMASAIACTQSTWGPGRKDDAMASVRLAIRAAESAFATITGESISIGGLQDAFSAEGVEHLKVLQDCWTGGLQGRLAPFAYEPGPGPGPEIIES